jgi:predicted nucleic acid-binding protein
VIYLDTSALVKLYVLEEGSEDVNRLVTGQFDPLPVWEIQEMELTNALNLKVFSKELTPDEADRQIALFGERKECGLVWTPDIDRPQLLAAFRRLSAFTRDLGCRTLDILHVACAAQLAADHFATFDTRQLALAKRAGLKVWEPRAG